MKLCFGDISRVFELRVVTLLRLVGVRRPLVARKVRIPKERTFENEMVISRKVGIFQMEIS